MKRPHALFASLALPVVAALIPQAHAQGFLGHEISMYSKFIDEDGKQPLGPQRLIGTALVGSGQEFGASKTEIEGEGAAFKDSVSNSPPTDFDAFTIDAFGEEGEGFKLYSGQMNGLVFEDTNDTLPPFVSVTTDEAVSTIDTKIFVTPNSIWLNNEGAKLPKEGFFARLNVTFADAPEQNQGDLAVYRVSKDDLILEARTQLGAKYVFEQSHDLITFTRLYDPFIAIAPFRTRFVRSPHPQSFYRLRLLEEPSIPLQNDFESETTGWTQENEGSDTQWEWGTPNTTDFATAASGSKAWGTDLDGDYAPDTVATLRSPLVDLSNHDHEAALTFRYIIDTPNNMEGGQLRFVDAAGEVLHIHEGTLTGSVDAWTPIRVVLPESLQDAKFHIEFRFLSDLDDEVGAGWFIDDVLVL